MKKDQLIYKVDAANVTPVIRVRPATSFWARGTGWMFRRRGDYAIWFDMGVRRMTMTNLFVFISLDMIALDASLRVIAIRSNFKPFSLLYVPPPGTRHLVEIPHGHPHGLKEGSQLAWGESG